MKQYFAKCLPVEGEIKEGDTYWNPRRKIYQKAEKGDDFDTLNTEYKTQGQKAYQKVKLFLCSRDIQVGDRIYSERSKQYYRVDGDEPDTYHTLNPTGGWKCDMEEKGKEISSVGRLFTSVAKAESFKVIGEISPEAIWVKEGDEFNEEQVQERFVPYPNAYGNFVGVKCPTCNHFH